MQRPTQAHEQAKPGVKRTIYFPTELFAEMQAEADRLQRSVSWVACCCWRGHAAHLRKIPTPPDSGKR